VHAPSLSSVARPERLEGSRYTFAVRKGGVDGVTVLERAPKIARARKWAVVFYNDDYTTKWFVVQTLQQFFHMSETSATALMMAIHSKGKGIAGTYSRDIAETKADQVLRSAREFGMPLRVTAEPDADGDSEE
jgi:ATP-dependent Clp protease adaptor protein ClpS